MIELLLFVLFGVIIHNLKAWQQQPLPLIQFFKMKFVDIICAFGLGFVIVYSDPEPVSAIYSFTVGYSADSGMKYLFQKYNQQ